MKAGFDSGPQLVAPAAVLAAWVRVSFSRCDCDSNEVRSLSGMRGIIQPLILLWGPKTIVEVSGGSKARI